MQSIERLFTQEVVQKLFPLERSNEFFEALFGDAHEGAYDITLRFGRYDANSRSLDFFLDLHQRPGRCLACNLTQGLPEVFMRHPIINLKGLVAEITQVLGGDAGCESWLLGRTIQHSPALHSIPLHIHLNKGL